MGQNLVSLEFLLKLSPSIHEMENDWMEIWLLSVHQVMISYRHNCSILLIDQLSSDAHLVVTHYMLILIALSRSCVTRIKAFCRHPFLDSSLFHLVSGWVTLWNNCSMLLAHSWDETSLNLKKVPAKGLSARNAPSSYESGIPLDFLSERLDVSQIEVLWYYVSVLVSRKTRSQWGLFEIDNGYRGAWLTI